MLKHESCEAGRAAIWLSTRMSTREHCATSSPVVAGRPSVRCALSAKHLNCHSRMCSRSSAQKARNDEKPFHVDRIARDEYALGMAEEDLEPRSSSDVLEDVNDWFGGRGFKVIGSDRDYSDEVRKSPHGKRAPSRHHHIWVDLCTLEGRVVQRAYGSGTSIDDAARRARVRYTQEQEGGEVRNRS